MMTCEEAALLLSARLDGELTESEEGALTDHLAQCPECRAIAAQLEELRSAMAGMQDISAPADFTRRVMDSLGEQETPQKVVPLFRRPQFKALTGLAACALLCVGLYSTFQHQDPQPATMSTGAQQLAPSVNAQVAEPEKAKVPERRTPALDTQPQSDPQETVQKPEVNEAPAPSTVVPGAKEYVPQVPSTTAVTPFQMETGTDLTELEDSYNTVRRGGDALLALKIPEGWTSEPVEEQGRTGFRFRPEGREGAVCLCRYETPVGVCGTGLVTEQVQFPSGSTWTVGTYDGHDVWDFLYPGEEPGLFLAELEPGVADWWEEFKGEAIEILDTARLK